MNRLQILFPFKFKFKFNLSEFESSHQAKEFEFRSPECYNKSNGNDLATKRNRERKSVDVTPKLVASTKAIVGFALQCGRKGDAPAWQEATCRKNGTLVDSEVAGTRAEDEALGTQRQLHSRCLVRASPAPRSPSPDCSHSLLLLGWIPATPCLSGFSFPRHFPMEVVNRNPTFGSSLLNVSPSPRPALPCPLVIALSIIAPLYGFSGFSWFFSSVSACG